jgi:hypothetical protein
VKAYKIIQKKGRQLYSFSLNRLGRNDIAVEYLVNQKVTARVGKLFVFATEHDARNWFTSEHDKFFEYWEVEVDVLEDAPKMIPFCPVREDVEKFWKEMPTADPNDYRYIVSPEGTKVCNEVTLLKKL